MIKEGKLQEKKMVRSDVSGKLYMSDDCEVIVFRIVKAKNEDVNDLFNTKTQTETIRDANPNDFSKPKELAPQTEPIPERVESKVILPSRGPGDPVITEADLSGKTKLRTVIPRGMASVFIPHTKPGAATEHREA